MGRCVTEYQAISCAQYLDLVYSQSGILYDLLPDGLRPSTNPPYSKSMDIPLVDGIIGSVSQTSNKASMKKKSISNIASNPPSKPSLNPGKASEVNVVQSTTVDKASKGRNKGKEKVKYDTPKQILLSHLLMMSQNVSLSILASFVRKISIPRIFPRCVEVSHFLKGTPRISTVLKEPFPSE